MGQNSVLAGGGNAAGIGSNVINNNNNHGDGGVQATTASKYRVNKIQHAVSMSPGGPGSNGYMLNKNLRTTNNDHLNNIGSSG